MGTGDYGTKTIKILKGKHTIRIQIKHASVAVLESINDMPMQLKRALKTPVNLSFFLTQSDALVGTNKLGARFIAPGGSVSFFFREPTADQIPKGILPGDTLSGKVTYIRKDKAILGCGTKPGGYDVKYVIGDTKPAAASTAATTATTASASASSPVTVIADGESETTPPIVPSSTSDTTAIPTTEATSTPVTPTATSEKGDLKGKEKEKEKESGIDAAVREAKTKYLKSQIGNPTAFDSLYLTVEAVYPKDLALKLVALSHTVKCKQTALDVVKKGSTADTIGEYTMTPTDQSSISPHCSILDLNHVTHHL
jgi:Tripeptidyl peptidase II